MKCSICKKKELVVVQEVFLACIACKIVLQKDKKSGNYEPLDPEDEEVIGAEIIKEARKIEKLPSKQAIDDLVANVNLWAKKGKKE